MVFSFISHFDCIMVMGPGVGGDCETQPWFLLVFIHIQVEALEELEQGQAQAPVLGSAAGRLPQKSLNHGGNDVLLSRCYGAMEPLREDEQIHNDEEASFPLAGANTLGKLKVRRRGLCFNPEGLSS